jgi:predicted amidophosphoribosyltransferase
MSSVASVASMIGSVLFPVSCPGCGTRGSAPCRRCLEQLEPAGLLELGDLGSLDAVVSLMRFEGVAAKLVTAIKYANRRDALQPLAGALARLVAWRPDVVTWVPTTAGRRRTRGFDHAELIASAVASHLGAPCAGLLARRDAGSQTGRSREERLESARFEPLSAVPPAVLVVDDVCTTGASLRAAAEALRSAGATEVGGATLAATP